VYTYASVRDTFQSKESPPEDEPNRPKLQQAVRDLLPWFAGERDTKIFTIKQGDNGYGTYFGVASLNARTGELKLASNAYAP
jgi:hypothetical protein